jgi:hypothetical protein
MGLAGFYWRFEWFVQDLTGVEDLDSIRVLRFGEFGIWN